jgi:hypothetical protein
MKLKGMMIKVVTHFGDYWFKGSAFTWAETDFGITIYENGVFNAEFNRADVVEVNEDHYA